MSLIVWYPFTKDIENKGLSNISETVGSGVSLINSNKFGTSVSFDGNNNGYISLANFPTQEIFKENWSISFWCNFQNDGNRGIILASLVSTNDYYINLEINKGGETDNKLRLCWMMPDFKLDYLINIVSTPNTWVHLTLTYNGQAINAYKNGILEDTKSITLLYSDNNNPWYFGRDSRNNNRFKGELHDFRIYNHCLSVKEIKELSKGLILHHALKGYGAGENILPQNSITHSSIEYESDMGQTVFIRDTTATTESYLGWGRTGPVEQSTEYTFSCMLWLDDNVKSTEFFWLSDTEENKKTGGGFVNITSTNGTNDTIRINNELKRNQWNYVTWTFTTKADDYTGFIRVDNNGSKTEGEHAILKVCCPKLEKGSKATPFLPYSLTKTDIRTVPSTYAPLEYIEGTGTQYINTGYVHKATTRIDIVCELSNCVNQDYGSLFGSRKGTNVYNDFSFYTISGSNLIFIYARTGKQISTTNNMLFNEKILISAYDTKCSWYKYGSSTAYGSITNTGTIDAGFNNMTLFCINKSTTADGFSWDRPPVKAKIYSCKIWDDDGVTLVRDLIPVMRKSDKKIGLYDAVNDTFYTNAGTGEFLTSSDIIEEDLSGNEFNGTRQGVTFTPDSPRYYMSTEFDANKDLLLDRIFHQGDEVSNLSISIWFNPINSESFNTVVFSLNDSNFIRMQITSTTNVQIASYMNDGIQYFNVGFGQTIELNNWYHTIITFDNGIFKFYVNGNLISTTNKSSIATTMKCNNSTGRWSLGDYIYGNKFIGKLSDFRIYAKTLTADEVTELYKISASIDKSGKIYCGEFVEE